MKKIQQIVFVLGILFSLLSANLMGQNSFQYELSLVPVSVPNLPGLHSYAHAQHNGLWLIVGGRKDGLHPRQPFNAFPASQNNTDISVVDVANAQYWSASVSQLPADIAEQMQSTNMNFWQDEDTLYIIGGYGFSATANTHITYPQLTTIHVSGLIQAVQTSQPISSFFKKANDNVFAVTGGHLKKLNGTFYLVGGHRFDGQYNPMGHATYTQVYTNEIRKFSIDNSGNAPVFSNYVAIADPVHLRRRDYNLLPQIFPNGQRGFTISSGVFQLNADLPFLYPVDITENGYNPITSFNQYLSNYHSAVACLYDSVNNQMHSLFFGGMSQYYYQGEALVQDNLVPFVKTISRLTRDAAGNLSEYQMSVEMPSLKGASAEFIINQNLPQYSSEIIKLSEISQNQFMLGHIYGGIQSSAMNPFSSNQTSLTAADPTIYEVWLTAIPTGMEEIEIDGQNPFVLTVYPNPFRNQLEASFNAPYPTKMQYMITNISGQIIYSSKEKLYSAGEHSFKAELPKNDGNTFFLTLIFDNKFYCTEKLIRE
jgi:hypothetical protein